MPRRKAPHFQRKQSELYTCAKVVLLRKSTSMTTSQKLEQWVGDDLPDSVRNGQRLTGMTAGQASFPIAPSMLTSSNTVRVERELVNYCRILSIVDDVTFIRTLLFDDQHMIRPSL